MKDCIRCGARNGIPSVGSSAEVSVVLRFWMLGLKIFRNRMGISGLEGPGLWRKKTPLERAGSNRLQERCMLREGIPALIQLIKHVALK